MPRIFINCRQAHGLMSAERDRDLDWRQGAVLRLHLMRCDSCSIVRHNFTFLAQAARRLDSDADR